MDDLTSSFVDRLPASRCPPATVESVDCEGRVLVIVAGELDISTAPLVGEVTLASISNRPTTSSVEVDVSA